MPSLLDSGTINREGKLVSVLSDAQVERLKGLRRKGASLSGVSQTLVLGFTCNPNNEVGPEPLSVSSDGRVAQWCETLHPNHYLSSLKLSDTEVYEP